jgi:uncharacterized membrane-anchored protein YhcB (DUF1043 family)
VRLILGIGIVLGILGQRFGNDKLLRRNLALRQLLEKEKKESKSKRERLEQEEE